MSLIIADEEFWRGATRIRDISKELLDIFESYSQAIQLLTEKGICDVLINNVLSEKLTSLSAYGNSLSNIVSSIVENTNNFITNVDCADSYLYD